MKKIVLLSLILIFTFTVINDATSQTETKRDVEIRFSQRTPEANRTVLKPSFRTILFESFENDFPPSGWLKISDGTAPQEWAATSTRSHSGNRSAFVNYCAANQTMDEWLITPAIDLSLAPAAKLVFYEDQSYWSGYGHLHFVKVSTTSQSDKASFQTLLSMSPSNHEINGFKGKAMEIDLTNYVGQTIYIAFQYIGTDADVWFIDDVGVYEPDEHDVRVINFDLEEHYAPGTSVQPIAVVENVGLNDESFQVSFGYYDWKGNFSVLDTKMVSDLGPGISREVQFNSYTFPGDIQYTYFVRCELSTDLDSSNDLLTQDVNTFTKKKAMVLVEKGTGTWCGYCPGSALAIDRLYKNYHQHLAVLEYHSNDAYENTMSNYRLGFYGVTGFPTAIFDGTEWRVGGSAASGNWMSIFNNYESIFKRQQSNLTGFSLDLQFTSTGDSIKAVAKVTYEAVVLSTSYRIFFALNESEISESWQGLDHLNFVARAMYPDHFGLSVYDGDDAPAPGMVVYHKVNFRFPSDVVKKNSQLIAFIQDMNSKQIAAVAKVDLSKPSAVEIDPHTFQPVQFTLKQNYPNPFNPETWIQFHLSNKGMVDIAIYNIRGERIRELAHRSFDAGEHKVHWDGTDSVGQETATGIYYVKARFRDKIQMIKMVKLK